MAAFHACAAQEVDSVGDAVEFVEHHPFNPRLDYEFRAVKTGRGRDIERGAVRGIVGAGHFGDSVGLGVEYIGLGQAVFVLTHVFKPGGSPVEAVGNDGAVLYEKRRPPPCARNRNFPPRCGPCADSVCRAGLACRYVPLCII